MRILALYSTRTLSLVRRVLAPFSVLSNRGYSFAFMQVPTFDPGYAGNYDLTILQNWILKQDELASLQQYVQQNQSRFVYDLADPQLLQIPSVLETLRSCALITVPNEHLAKEVKIAAPGIKVAVLPSTIDIPYLMSGTPPPVERTPTIGCFGPFDWELVRGALQQCRDEQRKIMFLGSSHAQAILGDLVAPVDLTVESYPSLVRQCHFGLLPIEQPDGRDLIWRQEYGILGNPVLKSGAKTIEKWMKSIKDYAYHPNLLRTTDSWTAQEQAKEHSAVRLADAYVKIYRQMLPRVASFL